MKFVYFIFILSLASIVQAQQKKLAEKKDFSVICAFSKAAEALSKDRFITDPAERVIVIWSAIEASLKTEEVKSVIKAVTSSDPSQKIKLMKQGATDVGLKNWNCKSIKYLF